MKKPKAGTLAEFKLRVASLSRMLEDERKLCAALQTERLGIEKLCAAVYREKFRLEDLARRQASELRDMTEALKQSNERQQK